MELEYGTWLLAERQKRVTTFCHVRNSLFVAVVHSPAALPAKAGESPPRSRPCSAVRTRPRVAFRSGPRRFSAPRPQKASGLLIRSILNEYTDFTKLDRALVSNQEAEHHGY